MSSQIKGIGASPGISIGRARVLKKKEAVATGVALESTAAVLSEIDRFRQSVLTSLEEVETLKAGAAPEQQEGLDILETHIELISDPQLAEDVTEKIKTERKTAHDALLEVIQGFVELFAGMEDEYMRGRAADVRDIGNRILGHLEGGDAETGLPSFEKDTILIAEDIAPSDTVAMDISLISGFAMQMGGKTSHAAIVAKSRGIPAVVGCGKELQNIKNGDLLVVDGAEGWVLVNPAEELLAGYRQKREALLAKGEQLKALKTIPVSNPEGIPIQFLANISHAEELEEAFEQGGAGVGLLRTELLFMGRDRFPTEEEQFGFYREIALASRKKPVVIRTMDIGGDKSLPYFGLPKEENPFLGYRAIRISLDRKDLFLTQLKAILRAGVSGSFSIMFPMISSLQELRSAKALVGEAKKILLQEGVAFADNIPMGIMIEIPSAAVMADLLAREADFFSIGTNDLCQYTLAVDRMNEKIKDLYDPFNPGVLRLISNTIEQGHRHGIPVAMCGEMASDPLAALLLVGMGLHEFSMSAASIPVIKNTILRAPASLAKEVCKKVMAMDNSQDIIHYLQEVTP